MKNITFGIIGCGDVTEKKSGPAFQKLPHTTLKWVMRRNEEKLKDYARRHRIEHYTTDYKEILEDPEVDAVYIATPPYMHKFYTIEAAKHKKDVYVEKPMALSVEECVEMMEVCKAEGVKLFAAYYRRSQKKFRTVKELLGNHEIGEIRSFHYHYVNPLPQHNPDRAWLYDPKISGGGQLYDVGSHMMDMILYLFGDVGYAKGISRNQAKVLEVEDNTSGILLFRNGVQGTVQLTFNGKVNEDQMVITGSEGTLKFSIMNNEPLEIIKPNGIDEISFEELEHVQMPLISDVALAMGKESELDSTGLYGLRTQEVIEAFRDSREIRY
ncbi:Gfo/Idh/MocA family protein [Proteiniclasticum sp. C24MP]|uniref:Gfo/Idh/MocA family protein n=1 Tax=Proteiniclasticum sp. C24MP TaxID=3374101 RepID=UPI00375423E4